MRNNIIGERIKEVRSLHSPKMTQKELVAKLQLLDWDINRGGIAKIESGVRHVTDKEVLLFFEALGVPVAFLVS